MKKIEALSLEQRELVENNIGVVWRVIYEHIQVNERVFGLSYDDLVQEGSIWLCKAAATYDGKTAKFETYAKVVVKNGLLTYCRNMCAQYRRQLPLQELMVSGEKDGVVFLDFLAVDDFSDTTLSDMMVINLLESVKSEYNGVAQLGIEALKLKVKGFSGGEIARLYGVAPNHVGAWISRASRKLRKNDRFLAALKESTVENMPSVTVKE